MPYWLSLRGEPPMRLHPGVDVTIGRGRHCDLTLYSSLLSREHARIRWEGEQPVLFDLQSLNGIFIGPDRIHRRELRDGDLIRLGDHLLLIRCCEQPPPILDDDFPSAPVEAEEGADAEDGQTRLFSRTAALQREVFEYDELAWLLERLGQAAGALREPELAAEDASAWVARGGAAREELFWQLLRAGVLAPVDFEAGLRALTATRAARRCVLTRRGERLTSLLGGKRVHWNEMAALRYRVRQGPAFHPLRMIARAYRPGGGLAHMRVADLVYELENIYAPDLGRPELERELRRLLCLGVLWPAAGARDEAWYPDDWSAGVVTISPRGLRMLEGFRLEE